MRSLGRLIILPMLMSALAGALAAQTRPDSVALSFDWPVGLEAGITLDCFVVKLIEGEPPDSTSVTVTYAMRVQNSQDGRRVEFADFRFPGLSSSPGTSQATDGLDQITNSFAPSLLVSDSGGMIALADPQGFANSIRAQLEPLLDKSLTAKPEFHALLQRVLDPAVLTAQAEADWNSLVGWWAGARMVQGRAVVVTGDQEMPLFPGRVVPYHNRYTLLNREPCDAEGSDSSCVALEVVSSPDTAAVRALVVGALTDLTRSKPTVSAVIRQVGIEHRIRLITEPHGLVPHALSLTQNFSVELEGPNGSVSRQAMRRSRVFRYTYPKH